MKKIISLIFLLLISHTAFADHRGYWSRYNYRPYYGHHPYYSNNFGNFVAPALIGGIIGYQLGHPNVYYTSPSVIYNTPGTIVQQSPTVIQNSAVITNGTPLGYHTEVIKDADCNCYRNVLVRD